MKQQNHQDREIGFFRGSSEKNNVISYLERHCALIPKRKALLWKKKKTEPSGSDEILSVTFDEFYEKTSRLASGLRDLGIQKNDSVIIFLPMSVELYQSMFAVLQLGAIAVFLDSWARRTHLGACADTVTPKAMISFEQAFEFCREIPEIHGIPLKIVSGRIKSPELGLIRLDDLERESKVLGSLVPVEGHSPALVTFTTGSSGRPKGANRTHEFLSAQHLALKKTIPYEPADIDLPAFPIFSLNNLASGVTTVIPAVDVGAPTPRDPQILVEQLVSTPCTCSTLSPSMLREIARYCRSESRVLPALRRVVTGGAPITNDDLRNFASIAPQAEIWVLYGSTEVEPIAHLEAKEILSSEGSENRRGGVNVGHFADGLEVKFIKIHKEAIEGGADLSWQEWEVAAGEVGEVLVSGLHVCKSYYRYPEATRTTKIIDRSGVVWHRTGDLGYLDSKGRLWLVGRVHNAIQRKGEWLFPVQAEIILKTLSWAQNVAYLGIPDNELGERTAAVLEPRDSSMMKNASSLGQEALQILRNAQIPADEIWIIDSIPMDPRHHSKVEYSVLRDSLRGSSLSSASSRLKIEVQ